MRLVTLLAAAAVAVAGVGSASAQTLRIGLNEDPDVLDPDKARTFVGRIVFTSLCDKLVDITPKLEFVPALATSWEWGGDTKSLTFTLRPGVVFHDGTPFNAEAVKFNIERSKTLEGSLRKSDLASVERVEVVDDLTARLVFSKADATVLAQLSDRAGMMISPKAGPDFAQNPVCSGPYRFVERVQNDRIELEKFPQHRDAADHHFERVVYLPIPDTTVRLANLQAGDLDLIERLAATDIGSLEGDDDFRVQQVLGLGYDGIDINTNNGPRADTPFGRDPRVRRAFALSIDRNIINQVVYAGTHPPAAQPFPPASPYFDESYPVPGRDVAAARKLLQEAGQESVTIDLAVGNDTTAQQIGQIIQAMAAEAGFQVNLRPTEFAAMLSEQQEGNFVATQVGWSGRPDPDGNIFSHVSCGGGLNDGKYCNPEVDRLLNQARQTTDVAKRKASYDAAQEILRRELPTIYLNYEPWIYASTSRLEGFAPHPDGMIRLKGVRLGG